MGLFQTVAGTLMKRSRPYRPEFTMDDVTYERMREAISIDLVAPLYDNARVRSFADSTGDVITVAVVDCGHHGDVKLWADNRGGGKHAVAPR